MDIVIPRSERHNFDTEFVQISLQVGKRQYPRDKIATLLHDYNQKIGNDAAAFANIEALKNPQSVCVITGQQLGLMGGPSYTILKAISCLLVAREKGAIPIFWLATEDHDIVEIDHAYLLDPLGNLKKYTMHLPKDGRPVEDLELSAKNQQVLHEFLEHLKLPTSLIPEIGTSYSLTMANFLTKLFAGTGLVFLEPRLLRTLAVPFFQQEIADCDRILSILQATSKEVAVPVIPFLESTNLFMKTPQGLRRKIRKIEGGFWVGQEKFSKEDLLELIRHEPDKFSTNVASRPLLQSLLFPTIAYVGGPSEIAYHQQLVDYFKLYGVPMPKVIHRLSASLIPAQSATILKKCHLEPWNPLPHHWIELMPEVASSVGQINSEWESSLFSRFKEDLSQEAGKRAIKYCLRKLQHRVCKSRLKKQQLPSYGLHLLHNLLHPHEKPQERVLNWCYFQSQTKENLIKVILEKVIWNEAGTLYGFFS